MKKLVVLAVLIPVFFLITDNKTGWLSKIIDGRVVSIKLNMQSEMELLPLGVMYRSNFCKKTRSDAAGVLYKEPGYHYVKMLPEKISDSNTYILPVPVNGGLLCQWRLSNVTIGMKYRGKSKYNKFDYKIVPITEIVTFDKNSPQRLSGVYKDLDGDVYLEMDYFPMINIRSAKGSKRILSIVRATPDVIYRAGNASSINFSPRVHSSEIIYIIQPKVKKFDGYISVKYPDGTTKASQSFPDYQKIQSLLDLDK